MANSGETTVKVYRAADAPQRGLTGEAVAVLGYGNLGRTAALNLRNLINRGLARDNAAWVLAAAKCGAEDGFAVALAMPLAASLVRDRAPRGQSVALGLAALFTAGLAIRGIITA